MSSKRLRRRSTMSLPSQIKLLRLTCLPMNRQNQHPNQHLPQNQHLRMSQHLLRSLRLMMS